MIATAPTAGALPPLLAPFLVAGAPEETRLDIAAVDVNGDGAADLMVRNGTPSRALEVFIAMGDGVFSPGVPLALPVSATRATAGRLDWNAYRDIVATTPGALAVFIASGLDAWAPAVTYPVSGATDVVVADLVSDSRREVAALRPGAAAVAMWTSDNLSGALTPAPDFPISAGAGSMIAADLDGNGKQDLIVSYPGDSSVTVYPGSTSGFGAPLTLAVGAAPVKLVAARIDGDNVLDLAISVNQPSRVLVFPGVGDGTFDAPQSTPTPGLGDISLADHDGDGALDLTLLDTGFSGGVILLRGHGDGTFGDASNALPFTLPHVFTTGDFDGDGRADLALAPYTGALFIALANPGGTFGIDHHVAVTAAPISIATGDLDGNGTVDLAVGSRVQNLVSIQLGGGHGTFARTDLDVGGKPSRVAIGDLDHVGPDDLVVAVEGADVLRVYLGQNGGLPVPLAPLATTDEPSAIAIADVNEDGDQDLVYAGYYDQAVTVRLGNGDGTFEPPQTSPSRGYVYGLSCGDFDGDPYPDLVVREADRGLYNYVSVMRGVGDGTFTLGPSVAPYRDFSGWADFAAFGATPSIVYTVPYYCGSIDCITATSFSVISGNGSGGFAGESSYGAGLAPNSGTLGHVDDLAGLDLVITNESTLSLFLNFPASPRIDFATGSDPGVCTLADVNGDGRSDLLVANPYDNTISILYNTTGGTLAAGEPARPHGLVVESIGPNPFRTAMSVALRVPERSAVQVRIYDCAGRLVRRVWDGELAAGEHVLRWDGTSESGLRASPGVYFCAIGTPREREVRRVVHLR